MKRHAGNHFPPEVAPGDLESHPGSQQKPFGQGQMISMAGLPPNIQPYQSMGIDDKSRKGKAAASSFDAESMKKVAAVFGAIWLLGVFLGGYDYLWPLYLLLDVLGNLTSIPPFSWIFDTLAWILSPLSWIFSWFHRGSPRVDQSGSFQEFRLPQDQVSTYLDHYVREYGDAALIFATHDGYYQIANALLHSPELGYADLIDATDENGNTALIYASAKGFRQCTAALLRSGADPDVANQGKGGHTPLMEAAGIGNKDIVAALRLSNASLNSVDDFGNTALHYAAYHGHLSAVHELLKGNPRRDIKNSYGHTAASYAASNKHKAIADLLNRGPSRREKADAAHKVAADKAADKDAAVDKEPDDLEEELLAKHPKKTKPEKHVKGHAEDLHAADKEDFAPSLEKRTGSISSAERKALEDQIAKLKRQHEDADLKAQKRIVELLERSSNQQKAVDDAEREARAHKLNVTELQLKVEEMESRHKSHDLVLQEERQRAERLAEELQSFKLEVDRHRSRAEGAERERELQADTLKRHEDSLRRSRDEVNDHLSRMERQNRELASLREEMRRQEEDLRRLRQEHGRGGEGAAEHAPPAVPAAVAPAPEPTQAPPTATVAPEAPQTAPTEGTASPEVPAEPTEVRTET